MRHRASQTIFAKNLRKRATEEERILWAHLAAKRFLGFKFRRQEPIGPYIVDFVCFERRLVVELDGAHHDEVAVKSYDAERSRWLCEQGFRDPLPPGERELHSTGLPKQEGRGDNA